MNDTFGLLWDDIDDVMREFVSGIAKSYVEDTDYTDGRIAAICRSHMGPGMYRMSSVLLIVKDARIAHLQKKLKLAEQAAD